MTPDLLVVDDSLLSRASSTCRHARRCRLSRAMNGHADIAGLGNVGLTGMQTHANADRDVVGPAMLGESALSGHCCCDGIARTAEGDEEGVALRVDLYAAMFGERPTKQVAVRGEHSAVALSQTLYEIRRAVDVGKEEGDGSAR